jgi:hypothetical protein
MESSHSVASIEKLSNPIQNVAGRVDAQSGFSADLGRLDQVVPIEGCQIVYFGQDSGSDDECLSLSDIISRVGCLEALPVRSPPTRPRPMDLS